MRRAGRDAREVNSTSEADLSQAPHIVQFRYDVKRVYRNPHVILLHQVSAKVLNSAKL